MFGGNGKLTDSRVVLPLRTRILHGATTTGRRGPAQDGMRRTNQKLTSALTPAINAGSADRSAGTTYCRSGVMRTAGVSS